MKKSVWSGWFINETPEEMIMLFEKVGYHYCELSYEHGEMLIERNQDFIEEGKAFGVFSKAHGITIPQGHIPLRFNICQNPEDLQEVKRYLDLYEAIGIKYCVLHCDEFHGKGFTKEEIFEKNLAALKELEMYIKGRALVICIENLLIFPKTIEDHLELLKYLDNAHFAICFDTGHLNMTGQNLIEFVKRGGNHIQALHIADNEGKTDQHMMPCGRGNIDFVTLFKEIKNTGYHGLYNLEIPGERMAPDEVKLLKLKYIDQMMDILDKLSEI
jgi:sugar phosphate isomerase/epimerase